MVTIYYSNQPGENSLNAAYRPVVMRVNTVFSTTTPISPVVYCDIYFGGVFYKTLSKTQYTQISYETVQWVFDIQDAAQEYLKKYIGENGDGVIREAMPIMVKAFTRVRATQKDANGFIYSEGTPPIQATSSSPAVSGQGHPSHAFFILNATLQHEDNQDLASHLTAFKRRQWLPSAYPLSHRPDKYHIGMNDSDFFGVVIPSDACISGLSIHYRFKGQSSIRTISVATAQECTAVITSLTEVQQTGTQNVEIIWESIGNVTGYIYRIDNGPWIATAATSVLINNMPLGNHSVDVIGVCQCSQGAVKNYAFTVVDPSTITCPSVVSGLTVTQTGPGEVNVNFTSSGPAVEWLRSLDGLRATPINTTTDQFAGLTLGSHTLRITPVCSNGFTGTPQQVTFTILGIPSITKVSETSAGPGNIRTQVFEIGPNVNPGNRWILTIYNVGKTITAVPGDTPATIAAKIRDAINGTSAFQWAFAGAAPPNGTNGFPPTATASGNQVTIALDWQNSFSYQAFIS